MSEEDQPKGFQELYDAHPNLSIYRYRNGAFQAINRMPGGYGIVATGMVHPNEDGYSVSMVGYDRGYGSLIGEFVRDPRTFIHVRRGGTLQVKATYPKSKEVTKIEPKWIISTLIIGLVLFDAYIHQVPIEKRSQYNERITDEMATLSDPLGQSPTVEEVATFNPQLASLIGEHLPGMRGHPKFLLSFLRNNPTLLNSINEN